LWNLLRFCYTTNLIGKDQFEKGIGVLVANVKDLELDVPTANDLLEEVVEAANNDDFISTDRAKVYLNFILKSKKSKQEQK
jgi:hypothetical protein